MRVAITGAGGRLGRALVAALEDAPFTGPAGPIAWTRAEFDLDAPKGITAVIDRDRPEVVINAAAWTDVDGCARDPALAHRRNAEAVATLAEATARAGVDLIHISTNEVFDGRRTDGRGYRPDDPPAPINAYGASKLAGERAAIAAYRAASADVAIVRTSWLFGPPGHDFPDKILAAADRALAAGTALRVVGDEFGSPTFTEDLAEAIVGILWAGDVGAGAGRAAIHHLVNSGHTSRAGWARELLRQLGRADPIEEVPASTWERASTPPAWGVLEPTPLPDGEPMPPWQIALAHYLPTLVRGRTGR